jgi:lysozyme family protein
MQANWNYCLKATLLEEGGNDDDPHDHGGRTSRGIIQREYDAYRKRKNLVMKDVWTASNDEIRDIYNISFWQPWCPTMPTGVDMEFFDMSVNAGRHEAILLLQRSLGVRDDGNIGIITLHAIETANPTDIVRKFAAYREHFYRGLAQFPRYGHDWIGRTHRIRDAALHLLTLDPAHTLPSRTLDDSQSV